MKTTRMSLGWNCLCAATLGLIALAMNASATVRYVDLNSTNASPPFTTWATAAHTIQDAVDAASAGDEIVVTNGVYQTGGRVVYGAVTNRVAVTKPVAVRSVNGPAVTVIQGYQQPGTIHGNGASAIRCAYLTNEATLTGFTLTNGATQSGGEIGETRGGGLWCESVAAVASNCFVTGNSAYIAGGAYGGTLINCTLTGNHSANHGGGASQCTLNNCTLTGNSAESLGGGSENSTLNNCTLTGNSAGTAGGGAYIGTLNNCTLTGNSAQYNGGGSENSTLNNCTLTGNSAGRDGSGASGGTLNNCIAYYNTGDNYFGGNLNYSCTTPLPGMGTGNFTNAPLFVDIAGGDLRLPINSACVNAGANAYAVGTTDLAGRPRIMGGSVDVGAHEFQGPYLNVAATVGGSVTRDPDQPDYPQGSLVTVTATPVPSFGFIRWSGDATGSTNPLTVVMDTNKNMTAVFASTALTLASQGVGTIARVPDQPFYEVGQQVTLSATAGRWHLFSGWTDGNASNPRTVTIGESNAYTAVFTPTTPLDSVTIGDVIRLAPVGMPAVVVDGVFILTPDASARGSALVALSTTFPGGALLYTLDGTDPAASGTLYAGPFTVGKAGVLRTIAYNADFTQWAAGDPVSIVVLPTLTGLTDGGGSVAIEPPAGDYFSNALALVAATPAPGWTFLQWLGDASGTNPVVNLTMTRNKTARAVFGTPLTTTVVGGGSIVVRPVSSWHPYGSQVRLTAVPATGNYLTFWANAAAGRTDNPLLFVVTNANPTVTAVFSSLGGSQTNALTVIPSGRGQVTLAPPGNRFRLNTNVVLQAIAEPGQDFIGWLGDATGSQNPLVVTMNSNKVIAAAFTQRPRLQGEGHPELLSQDGFRLTVTGEFGGVYEILGAADWSGWTPLGTVTNTWGLGQFTDPGAITNAHRWYRAREVE